MVFVGCHGFARPQSKRLLNVPAGLFCAWESHWNGTTHKLNGAEHSYVLEKDKECFATRQMDVHGQFAVFIVVFRNNSGVKWIQIIIVKQ